MKKILTVIIAAAGITATAASQTLFTYGKKAVDAKDFLKAYNKNNTAPVKNKAQSIQEYLDLYIKSRLKIQEAYERRYDTLPSLIMELSNLRTQITENYLNDPTFSARLVNEAFQRSQKDIHVSHIFISFRRPDGITDTLAAQQKRDDILQRLAKGEDFAALARQLSDDTSARKNSGARPPCHWQLACGPGLLTSSPGNSIF